MTRRAPAAIAAFALWGCLIAAGAASAEFASDRVRIGVLTDESGPYADSAGPGAILAAKMAAKDFGGAVKGHKIEIVDADTQNKPDVAAAIARRWYDAEGVNAIVDLPVTPVAFAVPAASACVSSAQWVLTGEQAFVVNSEAAEAVIMTLRSFCRATSCTARATGVTGRSMMAVTPSVSNHRRAIVAATSGLFCVSASTISILWPLTDPPKSSAAILAARIAPGPAESA